MGITVAVKVDQLPIANALLVAPVLDKSRTLLVPNLNFHGTVQETINAFIQRNLSIPEECQLLSAPFFTHLSEKDSVEDIYKRYTCQVQPPCPLSRRSSPWSAVNDLSDRCSGDGIVAGFVVGSVGGSTAIFPRL